MEECSVVFEELQQTYAQYTVPGYLNRFSKLYESHFEALITALEAEVPPSLVHSLTQLRSPTPSPTDLEEEITNVSAAMTLIHLTQAIYFQPNPSAIMAEDLMHWVNRLDSQPDPVLGDEIMRHQPACQHPLYWQFLLK
jgi:Nup85 Nucleoporin